MFRYTHLARVATILLIGRTGAARARRVHEEHHEAPLDLPEQADDAQILTAMTGVSTANKYEYNPAPDTYGDAKTLIQLLQEAKNRHPLEIAFYSPKQDKDGNMIPKPWWSRNQRKNIYTKYTWESYHDKVMQAAVQFVDMGLQPMDAVHIRGPNSPEWLISFLGCIAAGGLPVGLYPTDSKDALKFKAKDSGATFIVVGKVRDLQVYSTFIDEVDTLKGVVLYDGRGVPEDIPADLLKTMNTSAHPLMRYADFLKKGSVKSNSLYLVEKRIKALKPGQAATVVYTSGTTGNPKGVMLSHDALTWSAAQMPQVLVDKPPDGEHRLLSYLPLNHVAGQMMDIVAPIYFTAAMGGYVTTYFPAGCMFKKTCTPETLSDVRPTIFLGVPLVWDGLKMKIEAAMRASAVARFVGKYAPAHLLSKIGLNKVMYGITGAGPITKVTLSFMRSLGINLLNMYAQSESSAIGTSWKNAYFEQEDADDLIGSIGKPLGNAVKIASSNGTGLPPGESGEIWLKGRNVMLGYMNRADKNEEALTADGWLRTGDKGRQDKDGWVWLVGRIKEIMKDYGGEMIAPMAVEEGVSKTCNANGTILKQIIAHGDGYYYISVLVTLAEELQEGIPTGNLDGDAKRVDPNAKTVAQAQASQTWKEKLSSCIGEYNRVAAKNAEKIHRFLVLPKDISPEDEPDLMTPTFKIKRAGVNQKYAELIATCGGKPELGNPGRQMSVLACGT